MGLNFDDLNAEPSAFETAKGNLEVLDLYGFDKSFLFDPNNIVFQMAAKHNQVKVIKHILVKFDINPTEIRNLSTSIDYSLEVNSFINRLFKHQSSQTEIKLQNCYEKINKNQLNVVVIIHVQCLFNK